MKCANRGDGTSSCCFTRNGTSNSCPDSGDGTSNSCPIRGDGGSSCGFRGGSNRCCTLRGNRPPGTCPRSLLRCRHAGVACGPVGGGRERRGRCRRPSVAAGVTAVAVEAGAIREEQPAARRAVTAAEGGGPVSELTAYNVSTDIKGYNVSTDIKGYNVSTDIKGYNDMASTRSLLFCFLFFAFI